MPNAPSPITIGKGTLTFPKTKIGAGIPVFQMPPYGDWNNEATG